MKSVARFLSLVCLTLLLTVAPVRACIWDSDTLAMEAKGLPELPYIITGRFERNPPLYYEMRLKRVTAEIGRNPANLNLYDDAGVSCDRLGKGDVAVAWMAKKKAQLNRRNAADPATKDHLYRYYANLGTFLAHRWFRNGKDPKRISEVAAARDAIAKAIAINPNAHFGRERVQLYALEWLLDPKKTFAEFLEKKIEAEDRASTPAGASLVDRSKALTAKYRETAQALGGLVALGNAWESVDVFSGMSRCLELARDASLEYFCDLRVKELATAGKTTEWETALQGKDLIGALGANLTMLDPPLVAPVEKRYAALRANADRWHENRMAFMLARLKEGKHPDTAPDFWNGYQEIPKEPLDFGLATEAKLAWRENYRTVSILAMTGIVAAFSLWWKFRRKSGVHRAASYRGQ